MSYYNWHHGGVLCDVPEEILHNLKTSYDVLTKKQAEHHDSSYIQWQMQISKVGQENDSTFIHWQDDGLLKPAVSFFNNFVKHICRFRFSFLKDNSNVDYHCKHQLPRIHIPLNECDAIMVIKDVDIEHEIKLEYGKAYYTNVTKLHKVLGDSRVGRKNAFFCFTDFASETLKKQFVN